LPKVLGIVKVIEFYYCKVLEASDAIEWSAGWGCRCCTVLCGEGLSEAAWLLVVIGEVGMGVKISLLFNRSSFRMFAHTSLKPSISSLFLSVR